MWYVIITINLITKACSFENMKFKSSVWLNMYYKLKDCLSLHTSSEFERVNKKEIKK